MHTIVEFLILIEFLLSIANLNKACSFQLIKNNTLFIVLLKFVKSIVFLVIVSFSFFFRDYVG